MKRRRHDATAAWQLPQPEPEPPRRTGAVGTVFSVFWFALAASVAIAVVGAGIAVATDHAPREAVPLIAATATLPWCIIALLFTWVVYRRMLLLVLQALQDSPPPPRIPEPEPIPDIRLVPINRPRPNIDGQRTEDVAYFVNTICRTQDWTQSSWRGRRLPSGRNCNNKRHAALCQIVEKTGYLTDRRPGNTGHLTTRNAAVILAALGIRQ